MALQASWYLQDVIVLVILEGDITESEIRRLDGDLNTMLDGVSGNVYFIFDLNKMGKFPMNWAGVSRFTKSLQNPLIQLSINIVEKSNPFYEILGEFFGRIFKVEVRFVKTMDDALKLIVEHDPVLAEKLPHS